MCDELLINMSVGAWAGGFTADLPCWLIQAVQRNSRK